MFFFSDKGYSGLMIMDVNDTKPVVNGVNRLPLTVNRLLLHSKTQFITQTSRNPRYQRISAPHVSDNQLITHIFLIVNLFVLIRRINKNKQKDTIRGSARANQRRLIQSEAQHGQTTTNYSNLRFIAGKTNPFCQISGSAWANQCRLFQSEAQHGQIRANLSNLRLIGIPPFGRNDRDFKEYNEQSSGGDAAAALPPSTSKERVIPNGAKRNEESLVMVSTKTEIIIK